MQTATATPRLSAAALIARANQLKDEIAGRAAALAHARANDALGNPLGRRFQPDYYPRSIRRYQCAERLYQKAIKALADAGYVKAAIRINQQCAEQFKTIEQRRYALLMQAAQRKEIGLDQAPGLAFTGGIPSCRETEGRAAPEAGSTPYAPPRTIARGFAPAAPSRSAPATSRSTADA